jgi:nucleotide-binding universal stress UspA family protein
MPLKDILVGVDMTETGRERLDFALRLARAHRAHITAYYTSPTTSDTPHGSVEDLAEAAEEAFQSGLSGIEGVWLLSGDPLEADLVAQVRCCDIALLGLGDPERRAPDPQGFAIEDIVRTCGRPVLGLPVSGLPQAFVTNALVAWDGSRESARAINDALPLLGGAKQIEVVSIGRDGHDLAVRAVEHLRRHGIAAKAGRSAMLMDDIGSELLDRAAAGDADLIVAGAFGHAPLTENLFGGASRSLFRQMLVPVLFSH